MPGLFLFDKSNPNLPQASRCPAFFSLTNRTLIWTSVIEDDFRTIRESDLIVFQDKGGLDSPFTNLRVPDYEQYIWQHSGDSQMKVGNDISIYEISH